MRNMWEGRGDPDIARAIAPTPANGFADSIDERICKWSCRICGQPMHEIKVQGQYHFWSCDTFGCPNNQNTKILCDTNAEYIDNMINIGDTSKIWTPCIPRYIA